MNGLIRSCVYICFIVMLGCQQTAQQAPANENQQNIVSKMSTEQHMASNDSIAEHLTNIATSVPDVNQATALIAGPFAVVGIDVDKNLDRTTVGVIKYSVTEALHEDPYGKTAIVIADGDIRQRLKNMQTEITNGRPVQGVIDELAAIVGRYMPSMPVEEDKPIDDNNQENIIPDDDQEKLRDIQKEQSEE